MASKIKNIGEIKQNTRNLHICPLCKKQVEIGVELDTLKKLKESNLFPYPHIHLHGEPLHGLLCYIDKDLNIRSKGVVKSIEISRDSKTLGQIMKKWSNPY